MATTTIDTISLKNSREQYDYAISPNKDGTLVGYTSNDLRYPDNWTDVNLVTASDTNGTIFSKLTTMVRNLRYLYNKLGSTDFSSTGASTVTEALVKLKADVDSKAPSTHTHTVADLPVSSSQVNSTSYIPTAALLYAMKEDFTTKITEMQALVDELSKRV